MPSLTLTNTTIPYNLRQSARATRMRLRFTMSGQLEVTVPDGFPQEKVDYFLRKKQDWIVEKRQRLDEFLTDDLAATSKEHFYEHKEQALTLCREKVEERNQITQYEYGTIRVKRMKTRWGSCSSKRNLNFNYKILFLPDEAADYLVVHELCHLEEMNHSQQFWALVEEVYGPDYKQWKKLR